MVQHHRVFSKKLASSEPGVCQKRLVLSKDCTPGIIIHGANGISSNVLRCLGLSKDETVYHDPTHREMKTGGSTGSMGSFAFAVSPNMAGKWTIEVLLMRFRVLLVTRASGFY